MVTIFTNFRPDISCGMNRARTERTFLLAAGVIFVAVSVFVKDSYYANILRSWRIAWVAIGLLRQREYFYNKKPEHQAEYEEKETAARINRTDERKVLLRQMAGHKAYQVMFFVLIAVSFLFALLRVEWWVTGVLCLLWVLQYILGFAFMRYYEKRL